MEAAETAGITGAREFLEDPDAGVPQVRDDLRTYARGVTGVPHFIVSAFYAFTVVVSISRRSARVMVRSFALVVSPCCEVHVGI